ncbi:MAG: outer membrane protein assembly factor BamD [Bacteroidetes bacterium]|nr:outer membrane protein assembly factor BamD [Bacteroidota bacterium]
MPSVYRIIPLLLVALFVLACSSSNIPENPSASERFQLGLEEYADENYLEALNHFEVIRLQFPGSSVSDSARYYAGMCRYHREEYLLATYEFNQLLQSGRSSALAGDAYYMFSQCYYAMSPKVQLDQTNTKRAIDALQSFVEQYPDHPQAGTVEKQVLELTGKLAEKDYETAILYEKMENHEAALIYYSTVVDRYYNTTVVDDAYTGKIRMLMKLKRYREAAAAIEDFLERYPDSNWRSDVESMQEDLADIAQTAERPR